ncbi:hypothetical protein FF38_03743 [Lucilia cuprina]|uniref:Uncharacterized protein n=1 Tax=Lucilia cuprina TaxID=7375 RepID=A0A0L0CL24_LUCCU|nr:hypothetical protein FF38_03743 [Lucilia cuprina]
MSVRLAGCPCKPCAQGTGRNFQDNWMKFGTHASLDPRTKPIVQNCCLGLSKDLKQKQQQQQLQLQKEQYNNKICIILDLTII